MSQQVVSGAVTQCSFGSAPSSLTVLPVSRVMSMTPCANITDNAALVNIMPFGTCTSILNPIVAAATASALGVLTPMPCIPVTPAPWSPGCSTVKIGSVAALNSSSTCSCIWGGQISITYAGQVRMEVP
jgi:hypothetical protein